MAGFDMREKCALCRDKGLDKDPCIVDGAICSICDSFTDLQCEVLATPQYQIRKDKKAGLLVSPKDVTVLDSTSDLTEEEIRLEAPAHAQLVTSTGGQEFVSKQDFDKLSSQLDERFARFEALLSRFNIFLTDSTVLFSPMVSGWVGNGKKLVRAVSQKP